MGIEITYYCCHDDGKRHGDVTEGDVAWLVPIGYHRWRTVYVECNAKQVAINAYRNETTASPSLWSHASVMSCYFSRRMLQHRAGIEDDG
ncbi:hypothetical protein AVEN_44109-1 [Araneus ventricosus]|uniref:Uncharacterized protein n=1 Tax=Araneus ventricosus TaxID=182803 RepID=A0A4Y2DCM6_ARAVE|nr:hypothetical protein AVEN_44109-1 [Araneus ventricosus]